LANKIKAILALITILILNITLPISMISSQEENYFFELTLAQMSEDIRLAEMLATEFEKIGIKIKVETIDWGTWMDRAPKIPKTYDEGGQDIHLIGNGFAFDPDLTWMLHSESTRPMGWNYFEYFNGKADKLLEEGRRITNWEERLTIYEELMELTYEDQPYIPISWSKMNLITKSNLEYYDAYFWCWSAKGWHELTRYEPSIPGKDTFIWALNNEPRHVNPIFAMEGGSNQFMSLVFDTLVRWDKDKNIVPNLAESWEYSEDFLTLTFHLRDDVYWHDGEKLTAEDVVFTYKAAVDPEVGSVHAGRVGKIESIEAIDEYTVVFKFEEPYGPFLNNIAFGPEIVPKHILGEVPKAELSTHSFSTEHPIGTGPYKFIEWKKGEYIKLERNEEYFRGEPGFKYFYYKVIPDKSTALVAFENGEIDAAMYPWTIDEYAHLESMPDTKIGNFLVYSISGLAINCNHPYLNNKYIRQAMSYAIPRETICNEILGEHAAIPANQYYPPEWAGHNDELPPIEYDIDKAKSLMEKAGFDYDWIAPEKKPSLTDNPMSIAVGLVAGFVIGAVVIWALKRTL